MSQVHSKLKTIKKFTEIINSAGDLDHARSSPGMRGGIWMEWTVEGRVLQTPPRSHRGDQHRFSPKIVSSPGQIALLSNPTNRRTNVRLGEVANGEGLKLKPKKSKKKEGGLRHLPHHE